MKKSIMRQYFFSCAALIMVSICVLGAILMVFASQYFKEDKVNLLNKNVNNTIEITQQNYRQYGFIAKEPMMSVFSLVSNSIDANFFLTDLGGKTLLCSDMAKEDSEYCLHVQHILPQTIIEQLQTSGEVFDYGNFDGIYTEKHYTYGAPVLDMKDGAPIGYLFASMTVEQPLLAFLGQIFKMFIISSIAVLLIGFIFVYFISLQMVKPLRQMADAAQKFGKGEFAVRLPVANDNEIGQLAKELNNMAQSLSTMDSTHRSFIANVSHELKTPMTTIAGFIDGILDGTIPEQQQKYYLRLVSDEVKRLSRLVKTMLNLSKIEAGEMHINAMDIDILDTVIQILLTFEKKIEGQNIEIKGLDIDPVIVNADPDLIHQVVYNLVENAVKFTNESGYISFDFTVRNNRVYVSIQNSGMGLSKEEMTKVFERFYKSDRSRGLDKNGVGLGLYIVRSIVAAHGGEVQVDSVEGEYCRFTFSVPIAASGLGSK